MLSGKLRGTEFGKPDCPLTPTLDEGIVARIFADREQIAGCREALYSTRSRRVAAARDIRLKVF
jgi:hypothetical protein